MATDRTIDRAHEERLNHLYWNSSHTVDEIVDEMGVGRNTLYAAIQPFPVGLACSTCGDAVVFTNRTNRAAGSGTCLECGFEILVDEEDEQPRAGRGSTEVDGRGRLGRWRNDLEGVTSGRAVFIGGAAVLGVIFGAAAVKVFHD